MVMQKFSNYILRITFLIAAIFLTLLISPAANNVSVDEYTGTMSVNIPIYTVVSGNIVVPVSLGYNAKGIRVNEEASEVGLGWVLSAGGMITRTGRGGADVRMYFSQGGDEFVKEYGEGFDPFCHKTYPNSTNCDVVTSDRTEVDQWGFSEVYEKFIGDHPLGSNMEPDIFSFYFPGYSGRFVIDTNGEAHNLDGSPLKIEIPDYATIEITTPDGIKYTFGGRDVHSVSDPLFKRITEVDQTVLTTTIDAPSDWGAFYSNYYLDEIESPNGDVVTFEYEYGGIHENLGTVIQKYIMNYTGDFSTYQCSSPYEYEMERWVERSANKIYAIEEINFNGNQVKFNYTLDERPDLWDGGLRLDNIEIKNYENEVIKKVDFVTRQQSASTSYDVPEWNLIVWTPTGNRTDPLKKRLMLDKVVFLDPITEQEVQSYEFEYNSTLLPEKGASAVDYWGYFNGNSNAESFVPLYRSYTDDEVGYTVSLCLTNHNAYASVYDLFTNRDANETYMQAQILKQITYPEGGYAKFEYQAHSCNNVTGLSTVGGLCIKKIKHYDESGNLVDLTKYIYQDGKLNVKEFLNIFHTDWRWDGEEESFFQQPQYQRFGMSVFPYANARYIGYDKVTIMKAESADTLGRVEKYFKNNEYSSVFPDHHGGHPFIPIFTDKMNGLVWKTEVYSANDDLLTRSIQDYENTKTIIDYGLLITGEYCYAEYEGDTYEYQGDGGPCAFMNLLPYPVNSQWVKLTSSKNETWKLDGTGNPITVETFYTYGNSLHKQPTIIKTRKSDGSESFVAKYLKYPLDYYPEPFIGVGETADEISTSINDMLENNIVNKPIEILVINDDGSKKIVGGNLNLFNCAGTNGFGLPSEIWSKNIIAPQTYDQNTSWCNIAKVGSYYTFNKKSNYVEKDVRLDYENSGKTIQETNNIGRSNSYMYGYNNTYVIASAENAASYEIFYDSFEEDKWDANITPDNTKAVSGEYCGKISGNGQGIYSYSSVQLPVEGNVPITFKVSGWIYSESPIGTIKLIYIDDLDYEHSYSQNSTQTHEWEFIEFEFTVPATISGRPVVSVQACIGTPGLGNVWFDDIRMYPSDAELTTYTYKPLIGVTSVTDPSNRRIKYEYDNFGRLLRTRDENGYILQELEYNIK